MLITENIMRLFLNIYYVVTGATDLRPSLVNIDFDLLEKKREEIVSSTSRGRVRELVDTLLLYRKDIQRAAHLKEPLFEWYAQRRFEDKVWNLNPKIKGKLATMGRIQVTIDPYKVLDYFPVRVKFIGWGVVREGYMFKPTAWGMNKLVSTREELERNVLSVLDDLIEFNARYSHEDRSITLGSRTYIFNDITYPKALKVIGASDEARKFIAKTLLERLPQDLGSGISVTEEPVDNKVIITLETLNIPLPEEIADATLFFGLSTSVDEYPKINVGVTIRHPVLFVENRREIEITNLERGIRDFLEEVVQWINGNLDKIKDVANLASKYGYRLYPQKVQVGENLQYVLRRNDEEIRVYVGSEYIAKVIVYQDIGNRSLPPSLVVKEFGNDVYYHNSYGMVTISKTVKAKSMEEVRSHAVEIRRGIIKLIRFRPPRTGPIWVRFRDIRPEYSVALYLLRSIDVKFKIVTYPGNPGRYVLNNVDYLLRKIAPEEYRFLTRKYWRTRLSLVEEGEFDTILLLVSKGFVDLNINGEVVINGKPFLEIIRKIADRPEKYDLEYYHKRIAENIQFAKRFIRERGDKAVLHE